MFGIGFGEIVIIALLALILFGQDDLPANIRKAANAVKEFRKVTSEAQRAWRDVRNDVSRTLLEESESELQVKAKTVGVESVGAPASAQIDLGDSIDLAELNHFANQNSGSHVTTPLVIKKADDIVAQGTL